MLSRLTQTMILTATITAARPLPAQQDSLRRDTPLAAASLRADLGVLRRAYETLHPGLYRYRTREDVVRRFEAVDRYFGTDRTVAEAFLALTRLTAAIRCGHSYPNFYNQSKAIREALFEGQDKVPVAFRWLGRRMIVTADHAPDADLPRGTEILSIDGVPAHAILDSLLPLARADGGNDAKRVAYLEVQGQERFQPFDVLYPLVFPVREPRFTLVVRRPGTTATRRVVVAALTAAERRAQGGGSAEPAADTPLWRYAEANGIGVLTMPTWATFNSKWNGTRWLDSVLDAATARRLPDLVVDLRANEGGVDAGNQLLARLIDSPLQLPTYQRHVRYRRVPDDLAPYLDTWDPSFRDWGAAAVGPVDSLFYRLVRFDDTKDGADVVAPAATRYRGRVWVLVGAVNSSATFQFALAVKESGVATLVGQPTGGNRRGINGGAFFFLRLPTTGLEIDLPLIAGFPTTPQPDAGVVPDILVTPTPRDIAAGIDAEMQAVRRAIVSRRR
ncbi:MAG: peptidase S41 [Gemmatimonadetes bacterium]|nr:peptidase S41 [Gemmatimonadota bacterium]